MQARLLPSLHSPIFPIWWFKDSPGFSIIFFFCKKTKNIYYIELIDVQMYISKFFYKKKKKNGALQLLKLGSFNLYY